MARDTIHIRIGTHEEVNEEHVLANLEKVAQVDRFGIQITTDLKVVNLAKALNEYENAMSIFDRLRIFKSLVNSLELCANWKGVDNTGPAIDSVIASVSNVPQTDVADWRNLYNRTKHVDRSPVDQEQFVIGMEKLPSILPSIREAAKRLIIDRLNQI
jgi:FAD/FMN-containing dehydrogenase